MSLFVITSKEKNKLLIEAPIIKLLNGRQLEAEKKAQCPTSYNMIFCEDFEYPALALEN